MWRHSVRSIAREATAFRGLFRAHSVTFRCNGSCCTVSGKQWRRPCGFETGLHTFNSLTKQKEPLILTREGVATWYGAVVSAKIHCMHSLPRNNVAMRRVPGTAADPPCTITPTWVTHGTGIKIYTLCTRLRLQTAPEPNCLLSQLLCQVWCPAEDFVQGVWYHCHPRHGHHWHWW